MANTYMVFIDVHRCVEVVAGDKKEAGVLAVEQLEREGITDEDMEVVDVILVEEVEV